MAAGRSRSAATSRGRRPSFFSLRASFAHAVVFPEPWTPAIITTAVRAEGTTNRTYSPPSVSWSSSRTTLITCCAGVRLCITSSESARARTRSRNPSATSTATSASSSAVRMSASALSICFGCSFPRERSFLKVPSSLEVRVSNIGCGLPSAPRASREPGHGPGGDQASYSPLLATRGLRSEDLLDRLEERDRAERLGEVVVGAARHRGGPALLPRRGHHDHPDLRRRGVVLDGGEHVGPGRAGDAHVEQDQVGRVLVDGGERLIPVGCLVDVEPLALEDEAHRLPHRGVVFDDQDA